MNKWMMIGVILSLSLGSVFGADSVEAEKNLIEGRVPENGYGIVPMPYEVKAMAGNPFFITKETVIVARAAETKNYWWKRLKTTVDEELNQRQQPFIMSPAYWTYFDMGNVRGGWAKAISPAEVYNWDPFGDMLGVTERTRELAIGAIACTWSEKIPTMKVFGDRTYPRLASFSERIWRGGKLEAPNILSWPDYRDQVLIPFQLKRYDALGLHYWSKDKPELLLNLPDKRKQL